MTPSRSGAGDADPGTAVPADVAPTAAAPPVVVLTGQLAAGKSTLARALLERYPLGYHVDVDALREMVVAGLASPLVWTAETSRQFDLACRAACSLARIYHAAGFAVVIEGAVDPTSIDAALGAQQILDHRTGVILHPSVDVARHRNRERTTKTFDTGVLEDVIAWIDSDLASGPVPPGWTVLDNSTETVEQSVARLLQLVDPN